MKTYEEVEVKLPAFFRILHTEFNMYSAAPQCTYKSYENFDIECPFNP
jgi:hypothetical protein